MTGEEHYSEAERLLAQADAAETHTIAAVFSAAAQVHATLALAAAMTPTELTTLHPLWTERSKP